MSVQDIADILGTRNECARVQAEEKINNLYFDLKYLVGKKIQVDDPAGGYLKGIVDETEENNVHIVDIGWFNKDYITGIIS